MSKRRSPGSSRSKSAKSKRQRSWRENLAASTETVVLVLLVVSGLLLVDHIAGGEGPSLLNQAFGWAGVPVALGVLLLSIGVLARQFLDRSGLALSIPWRVLGEALLGLGLVLLAALGLTHLLGVQTDPLAYALAGQGGGLTGWVVGTWPSALLGDLITTILLLSLGGLGLWVMVRPFGLPSIPWENLWGQLRDLPALLLPDPSEAEDPRTPDPTIPAQKQRAAARGRSQPVTATTQLPSIVAQDPIPRKRRRSRPKTQTPRAIKPKPRPEHLPPLDLLAPANQKSPESADIAYKKEVIEQTLASFSVPVRVVDINVGPAVTQFGVEPGYLLRRGPEGRTIKRRVRVSRIRSLADDLALALAAPRLRIEAPVPGKGYVGIEVPNSDTSVVSLRPVLESDAFLRLKSPLAVAIGRDVSGMPVAANLMTMPHLLIAGATGSGKSVCINAIVASLLLNNGPDQLRLLLVDPKRVELPIYNDVPHLVAPVVTDIDQVVGALIWLTLQMDDRFRSFSRVGARHIRDYNRKVGRKRKPAEWQDLEPFPYLVLVVDELADLMMAAPDKVERYVCRLAQMARATGIHLVIATQRPSVDVVTGLIKANFPARIAFAVTSQTDSRVILDSPGAEKLLGQGDMLFMRPDSSKLARIQGCFVSEAELQALAAFWKEAMPPQELEPNRPRYPWTGLLAAMEDHDEYYERALDLVQDQERVSASWLQRKLQVGYDRAAELIARMEADGYVGPDEGAGRGREVLLAGSEEDDEDWLS